MLRVTLGSKGAVEERIHRLDNGFPIGLLAGSEQPESDERFDLVVAQVEPMAAKAVAAALSATSHPLGSATSGYLGV